MGLGVALLALALALAAWWALRRQCSSSSSGGGGGGGGGSQKRPSAWETVGQGEGAVRNPVGAASDFEMPSASLSRLQQLRAVKAQHGAAGLVRMFPGEEKLV